MRVSSHMARKSRKLEDLRLLPDFDDPGTFVHFSNWLLLARR
jgi:hypothetical protein